MGRIAGEIGPGFHPRILFTNSLDVDDDLAKHGCRVNQLGIVERASVVGKVIIDGDEARAFYDGYKGERQLMASALDEKLGRRNIAAENGRG